MFTGSPSRLRTGLMAALVAGALALSGCAEVAAHSSLHNFKNRAKQVRNEVKVMRPGEVGTLLDGRRREASVRGLSRHRGAVDGLCRSRPVGQPRHLCAA